ncbi:MAG TPA: bifunctional phosphoglucose/phosphomannose isomerase [Chloroflexi bacterium]|nr:bifunctional phosphoglucose/phosphomannose isomerase [Chloroflexota bacterium]
MNVDDYTRFVELDPDGMLGRIGELPGQCRDAWALVKSADLPSLDAPIRRVVVLGMGGSAIGGALVQGLVMEGCEGPVSIVRGYTLPAFVRGEDTLVVGCSHSGNTEETLACFEQALERGARAIAITTGGKLAAMAQQAGHPVLQFDYPSQPRAALGYSFTLLLGLFSRLGLVRDYSADLGLAVLAMEAWQAEIGPHIPVARNEAKAVAGRLVDRLPVIYGAGFLAAVANRWKTQFNENSKHWAFFEELPELHHNAVVGLGIPERVRNETLVLMLRSPFDHPRIQVRWDVTRELLQREGVTAQVIQGRGENRLAHMLSLIHLGDYVSYYLAMLNGVDPTPVESIAFLKNRLAEVAP